MHTAVSRRSPQLSGSPAGQGSLAAWAALLLMVAPFGCGSDDTGGSSQAGGNAGARAGAGGATAGSGGSKAGGSGGSAGSGGAGGAASGGTGGANGGSGGGGAGGSGADAGGEVGGAGGAGGMMGMGGAGGQMGADAGSDVAPDSGPPGPFALTSSAFEENGVIVRKYRCQYENVSPPLSWTPGPPGTRSYAVTMRSAGSPHWALWDIPADVRSLPEAIERLPMPPVPAGSKQCKPNVDGSTWYGYAGACPMGGTNLRPYYFEIFALDVERLPNVTPDTSIRQVNTAIMDAQLARATLIGRAAPQSP